MTEIFWEHGISTDVTSGFVPDPLSRPIAGKVHLLIRYIKLHPSH